MGYVKGKVNRISVKEAKEGQYGKYASYGLEIDGTWHNGLCNEDKQTGAFIIKDKDYAEVKEGSEIEFMTEEKNGYTSINRKTMTVLNKAPQTTSQPQVAQQPTATENVANNEPDAIEMGILRGIASTMLMLRFRGKPMPEDIDDKINRMTKYYLNQLRK
jgi:hypothetical protein